MSLPWLKNDGTEKPILSALPIKTHLTKVFPWSNSQEVVRVIYLISTPVIYMKLKPCFTSPVLIRYHCCIDPKVCIILYVQCSLGCHFNASRFDTINKHHECSIYNVFLEILRATKSPWDFLGSIFGPGIFLGFAGSPSDFFGSWLLAPFDHPRHLKSRVPPWGLKTHCFEINWYSTYRLTQSLHV